MHDFFLDSDLVGALPGGKIDLAFRLWELVLLDRAVLVLADSPEKSGNVVFALNSLVFPLRSAARFCPYLTVFDEQFLALQAPGGSWPGGVAGATNPLFAKLTSRFDACLDLTAESGKRLEARHGREHSPHLFLSHAPKPAIRPPLQLSKLLGRAATREERHINTQIVRKKLLALTLSFLEPLHLFLGRDPNDLKVFDTRAFLAFLKSAQLPIDHFYPSKAQLQAVYASFARTAAFESYMKAHFNFHARRA